MAQPADTAASKARRASLHLEKDAKRELYSNLSADEAEVPGAVAGTGKKPALITPEEAKIMRETSLARKSSSNSDDRHRPSSDADTDNTDRDDKVPLYDDDVPITDEDAVETGGTSADDGDASEYYEEQQLEVDDSDPDFDAVSDPDNVGYDTGAAADADNDTGSLSGGTEHSISLQTDEEPAERPAVDLYRIGASDDKTEDGAAGVGVTYLGPDAAAGLTHSAALESTCAYLLDCDQRVFVWVGSKAPPEAREVAVRMANDASKDEDADSIASATPVAEEFEGRESDEFKAVLSRWKTAGASPSPPPESSPSSAAIATTAVPSGSSPPQLSSMPQATAANDAEKLRKEEEQVQLEVDVKALLRPVPRLAGRMFEEDSPGLGDVDVYRLDDTSIVPVPDSDHGLFSSCFSYLVMYSYHVAAHERTLVYFWQGKHTPHFSVLRWKYDLVPELTQGLKDERGVEPECVRLLQGHESDHFLSLFTGPRRMLVWDDHRRIKVKVSKSSKQLHKYTKVSRLLTWGSLGKAWRKQTVALDAAKKVLVCAHSKEDVAKSQVGATIDLTDARFYHADYINAHMRAHDMDALLLDPSLEKAFFFEITSYGATPKTHYFGTASQREFFDWVSAFSLCGMVFASPTADATWLKYVVQPEIPADQLVAPATPTTPAAAAVSPSARTLEAAVSPHGGDAHGKDGVAVPAPRSRAQSITPTAAASIAERFGAARRMSVSSSLLAMNSPSGAATANPAAMTRSRSGSIVAIVFPTFAPPALHPNHLRCVINVQGFLLKRGYYQTTVMKRRFFRIGPDLTNPTSGRLYLHYFAGFDDPIYKPKGSILLNGSKIKVAKEPGQFFVEAADRTFLLQALTLEEEKHWIDVLSVLVSLPEHAVLPELKVDQKDKHFLWNWNGVSWVKLAVDRMAEADPDKEKRVGRILSGKPNRTPRAPRPAEPKEPRASKPAGSVAGSRSGTLRSKSDVKPKVESRPTLTKSGAAGLSTSSNPQTSTNPTVAAKVDPSKEKKKATISMKRLNRTPRRVGPPPGLTPASPSSAHSAADPKKVTTPTSASSGSGSMRASTLTRSSSSRSGTLTRTGSSGSTVSTTSTPATKRVVSGSSTTSAVSAAAGGAREKVRAQVKVARASAGLSMEDQQMLEYKELLMNKQKTIEDREAAKLAEAKPSKGTRLIAPQQPPRAKSGVATQPSMRVESEPEADVRGLRHALAEQKQNVRRKKKMSRMFLRRPKPNKNRELELARIRAVETDRQLFRLVFQGYAELGRAVEVECVTASLSSRHYFVLRFKNTFFIWRGKMVAAEFVSALSDVAGEVAARVLMLGDPKDDEGLGVVQLLEGEETDAFWAALGGKADHAVFKVPLPTLNPADVIGGSPSLTVQDLDSDPPMFRCRLYRVFLSDISGALKPGPLRFRIDRVPRFAQSDLNEEDCLVLDGYEIVFVWLGGGSKDSTQRLTRDFAQRYVQAAARKHACPIVDVTAGAEPLQLRALFLGWDAEYQSTHSPKRSFYPKSSSTDTVVAP